MEGFSSGSEGGEANEALFFAGLHCRHHADCAIGIGERRGFFGPRRRLGWRRLGWRLGRRLGRLRLLLSSLGSATSAAVLLLRRLEQRRLEQRPLEQRRLEQRRLGWRWRRLGWRWLVICEAKKLAAVEIGFFDRRQRAVRSSRTDSARRVWSVWVTNSPIETGSYASSSMRIKGKFVP